jgi:hypothetical protein
MLCAVARAKYKQDRKDAAKSVSSSGKERAVESWDKSHPEDDLTEFLLDVEDGKHDWEMCTKLHVWADIAPDPPTGNHKRGGKGARQTGNKEVKFAEAWSAGFGVMCDITKGTKAVAHPPALLQMSSMIGWIAQDTVKLAAKKPSRGEGAVVGAKRMIARVFVDYANDGMYVQNEDSDEDVGGCGGGGGQSQVKEDVEITQGLDVRQTLHQADMYKDDLANDGFREKVSEWADMNQASDGVRLPSFQLRLQTLGCTTNGASPVRIVMFTSPPFGWNLSPYDNLPADETQKEVTCK